MVRLSSCIGGEHLNCKSESISARSITSELEVMLEAKIKYEKRSGNVAQYVGTSFAGK